ncbi:MAG: DUF4214 domain-containing protein [Actinomycetota bacterium]|nr:DUF4214 domain-containing protein [Actinomycetota bacterium]
MIRSFSRGRRVLAGLLVVASTLVGLGHGPDGAAASEPGAPYTDTGCEGYSDSVARLYVAGLGRAAEEAGFTYWMNEYTSGRWTFPRMAEFFTKSDGFTATYGSVSDRGFVEQLYRNVLGREGDPDGINFWSTMVAMGSPRSTLLMRFAESPENVLRSGTRPPTRGYYNQGLSSSWSCAAVPDLDIGLHISEAPFSVPAYSRTATGIAHTASVALNLSKAQSVPAFVGFPDPRGSRGLSGTVGSEFVFITITSAETLAGSRRAIGSIGPCNDPDPTRTRYCNRILEIEVGAAGDVT